MTNANTVDFAHDTEPQSPIDKRADALKDEIDRTRSDVGETLTAIEQKLNPSLLREKAVEELHVVEGKVREAVKEQFEEAKASIKAELVEAKENVKKEVEQALVQAKQAVRAATIGKVEIMARHANQKTIEARDSMLDTLWQNPLPTALAGVGLVWLYMNRRSTSPSDDASNSGYYPNSDWRRPGRGAGAREGIRNVGQAAGQAVQNVQHKVADLANAAGDAAGHATQAVGQLAHGAADAAGQFAHGAAETAGNLVNQVSDGVVHVVHDAGEMGEHLVSQARDQARRVDESFRTLLQDNPLAVGAAALAAGALVGLALPRTSREDSLMGESRDQFLERARGAAHDAMDVARQVAQHSVEDVKAIGEKFAES